MVFSPFNNVFRKATHGQRTEKGDISLPTLVANPSSLDKHDASPRVARQKHPRPAPLSLSAQQPGQAMSSSIDTSELARSTSVSSGGAIFEMMSIPSSAHREPTPPIPNLPSQASPPSSSSGHKGEPKKNRTTRRRGVPSQATRPALRHRASSVDSPMTSPTALKTGVSLPSRKSSNTSSALSYSVCNDRTALFSPPGQSPSTAHTTPLPSASGAHFHDRGRLYSLSNTVNHPECSQAISPRNFAEHKLSSSASQPNTSATSLLGGISGTCWNVSYPTAVPPHANEEIAPDSAGLILEISQSADTGSQMLLEPVLHKRVGRDPNGKEWVKWELRVCLPPRRYGSSPAIGLSPHRMRRPSRPTALKLSGIGEVPTTGVAGTSTDQRPAPPSSKKKSLGPRPRGSSLLSPRVHAAAFPEHRGPNLGFPTRQEVRLPALVTQAAPSSSLPAQGGVHDQGDSIPTVPITLGIVSSQSMTQLEGPSSGISRKEDKKGLNQSKMKKPQPRKVSPSALLARRLAHSKLLGHPMGTPTGDTADFDLGRLSPYSRAPDVSYWSETEASQTGADDDDDEEDEKDSVCAGKAASTAMPDH